MTKRARATVEMTFAQLTDRLGCAGFLNYDEPELLTQAQTAREFGISTRAVRDLHDLGLPRRGSARSPRYPFPACYDWWDAYQMVQKTPGYRRRPMTLDEARMILRIPTWESKPDEYHLVPVEVLQALESARVRIDATALRRLVKASRWQASRDLLKGTP